MSSSLARRIQWLAIVLSVALIGCGATRSAEVSTATNAEAEVDDEALAALRQRLWTDCQQRVEDSCLVLGMLSLGDAPTPSLALIEQSCAEDNPRACYFLGALIIMVGEDSTAIGQAPPLLRRACGGGVAVGCSTLGLMYENGQGVAADETFAATLYRRACDGGDPSGCASLGRLMETGVPPENGPSAESLYQRACDGGDSRGCALLGRLLLSREASARDDARAVTALRTACDEDDAWGCFVLAHAHLVGRGLPRDFGRGADLLNRACEADIAEACYRLGMLYETGLGVEEDTVWARVLYRSACNGGVAIACSRLESVQPF